MPASIPKLALIFALPEELAAVKAVLPVNLAEAVLLIQGGAGPAAAGRAVRRLLAVPPCPALICSTGLCGALRDELSVGALVAGRDVAGENAAESKALVFPESWSAALDVASLSFHRERFVSLAAPVTGREQKRALAAARQAAVVDTESFALAAAATGVQVAVLRTVSDSVDDELPPETAEFLDENGRVRLGKVLRYALRNPPAHVKVLWRLKVQRDQALAALAAAWKAIFASL